MHIPEKNEASHPTDHRTAINPRFLARKKKLHPVQYYVEGIVAGNRIILGQAITLIESQNPSHQHIAQQIIEACLPYAKPSFRIGITGTPGVGKSTFIEALGKYVLTQGYKLSILAVDPSSQVTKGSIMGDKTRMQTLSNRDEVFIRPSPAGNVLGGVARKTRETIILCEAAGYQILFIETVGVGQSEISVHSMVDFFLLLLLPGAGDELQGIKRGIVEMADLVVVNKADGERKPLAKRTQRAYQNALHLYPLKASEWLPKVIPCSALQEEGLDKIWDNMEQYRKFTKENGYFSVNRKQQARYWMEESVNAKLKDLFIQNKSVKQVLDQIRSEVEGGKISPFKGAAQLIDIYLKELKKDDF